MAFGQNDDYINEIIRLGFDCNEKCLFCNYIPNKDIPYFKLDFEGIKKEIDLIYEKRKKNVNKVLLSFSGGEPTLWGEILIDSIKYAKNIGFNYIQIQTNATIITNDFAKKLKEAGLKEAFVSFHSCNSETIEKITFLKNSLKLTLFGIKNLKNNNIDVILSHVLSNLNYKEYPEFIYFVNKNDISKIISLGIVQPHGETEKNLNQLMINYKYLVPYIEKGNLLAKKYGINIGLHYCSIPLCIYEKLDDNLEFELLKEFRKGNIKLHDRIEFLKKDKIKLDSCKKCFYNNYCLGVWKKYIEYFGIDSIKPKKIYTDLSINKKIYINEKQVYRFFINKKNYQIYIIKSKIYIDLGIIEKNYIIGNGYKDNLHYLVYKKIDGNIIDKNIINDKKYIDLFIEKISKLHFGKKFITNEINEIIKYYLDIKFKNTYESIDGEINNLLNIYNDNSKLINLKNELKEIKNEYSCEKNKIYFIHGDLIFGNIIYNDTDIFFIDFEASRFGDFYYDLIFIEKILTKKNFIYFIKIYFKKNNIIFSKKRFDFMKKYVFFRLKFRKLGK